MKGSRKPSSMKDMVLEGTVRDVTDGGDAVVETSAGIVLARGGLPGERVRVRVQEKRAGVSRGDLIGTLERSPERIEPACKITERCGGCPLMSLTLEAQHRLKLQRVQRAVAGLGTSEVSACFETAGPGLGYRRRARMGFRRTGNGSVIGYRVHASQMLLDVAVCPVLEPGLERALTSLRAALAPVLTGSGEIELQGFDAERVAVSIRCDAAVSPDVYRAAEALLSHPPIVSVSLRIADGTPARFGASAADSATTGLIAPADSFSQVNASVNVRLGELVLELAQPQDARVLELYAGHGNFSVLLAERASMLLAVESDVAAADACRQNLRRRAPDRARVIAAQVSATPVRERFDVIVLDPPRGGSPELAGIVAQTKPARVVYVSCHMTTLARDLRALHAASYVVDRVHALDMFPHTAHVEAVVRMTRVAS